MRLQRELQRARQRLAATDPLHREQCPKCGSSNTTLKLTEWIIGVDVKDNGYTSYARCCNDCGNTWKREN